MLTEGSNTCGANTGSTSVTCKFVIDPISTNPDKLTVSGAFTAAQEPEKPFSITVQKVWNMPSTRPYNKFDIATFDENSYGIDTMTSLEVAMAVPATLPNS